MPAWRLWRGRGGGLPPGRRLRNWLRSRRWPRGRPLVTKTSGRMPMAARPGSPRPQRARLIAEATGRLSDEAARAVEERVLPAAGEQTTGMLRAALRRAVIAADPAGAERRRNESERRAKVVLYPDEET